MSKSPLVRTRARRAASGAMAVVVALVVLAWVPRALAQGAAPVLVTEVSGAIGVATVRQVLRAIDRAKERSAGALVVRLDTPGGLVTSTRDLIQQIVASPVPIVVYVAPSGARAASAGTFLAYAAHVAAMAPGTNIGAASPVEIGSVPGVPQPSQPDKNGKGSTSQTPSQRKAVNDALALLRSLAQLRGRNAEWADKAVRDAATLTAEEARKEGVVEIVASGIDDLLAQLDGRQVAAGGVTRTLATRGVKAEVIATDLRTRLLGAIADPNVAFILLMIGFYGLILEFWHPGTLVAGVVGGISLIVALVALTVLPVNYGALGLLVLGLALMIGEAFTPGIGVLGIGGLTAFVAGAYFLFEGAGSDIEIAVSLPLIIGMAGLSALLILGVGTAALQARKRPPAAGAEELIGAEALVIDWDGTRGHVRLNGEVWSARADGPVPPASPVRVKARDGLTLIVEG